MQLQTRDVQDNCEILCPVLEEILGNEVARLATSREAYDKTCALSTRVKMIATNNRDVKPPFPMNLALPTVFLDIGRPLEVVPSLFAPTGYYLIGEIRAINNENIVGLVIWCREDDCGTHVIIENNARTNAIQIRAYAISNTSPELVVSYYNGGLYKYTLTDSLQEMEPTILISPFLVQSGTMSLISQLAFSSGGNCLVVAQPMGGITIWDGDSQYNNKTQFATGGNWATSVAMGMNDTIIAKSIAGRTVELYDVASGELKQELLMAGLHKIKHSLQFSPNGEYLIAIIRKTRTEFATSRDYGIWHYHISSGRSHVTMLTYRPTMIGCDNIHLWCVSANHIYVFTLAENMLQTDYKFPSNTRNVVVARDKSTVAYRLSDNKVYVLPLLDIATESEVPILEKEPNHLGLGNDGMKSV